MTHRGTLVSFEPHLHPTRIHRKVLNHTFPFRSHFDSFCFDRLLCPRISSRSLGSSRSWRDWGRGARALAIRGWGAAQRSIDARTFNFAFDVGHHRCWLRSTLGKFELVGCGRDRLCFCRLSFGCSVEHVAADILFIWQFGWCSRLVRSRLPTSAARERRV